MATIEVTGNDLERLELLEHAVDAIRSLVWPECTTEQAAAPEYLVHVVTRVGAMARDNREAASAWSVAAKHARVNMVLARRIDELCDDLRHSDIERVGLVRRVASLESELELADVPLDGRSTGNAADAGGRAKSGRRPFRFAVGDRVRRRDPQAFKGLGTVILVWNGGRRPLVDWDAGGRCFCTPEEVEVVTPGAGVDANGSPVDSGSAAALGEVS